MDLRTWPFDLRTSATRYTSTTPISLCLRRSSPASILPRLLGPVDFTGHRRIDLLALPAGIALLDAQAESRVPASFFNGPIHELETVRGVEPTAYRVGFEDFEL